MKKLLFSLSFAAILSLLGSDYVYASNLPSITMAPLKYETQLGKNELKKGYVDIGNPSNSDTTIQLQIQGFRQIDDNGALEFYTDPSLAEGIMLDFNSVDIKSKEGMRIYFLIDAAKLPKGDVFAAIMASTVPKTTNGSAQSARVGTLLIMTNEGHGPREAMITWLTAPWLQIGDGLEANIAVKNTTTKKDTGFFPEVTFTAQPYASKTVQGPLLFAGRERSIAYTQPGNYFGPIYLKSAVASSEQGKWIFAITGYWRWVIPIFVAAVLATLRFRKKGTRGISLRRTTSDKSTRSYRTRR